MACEYCFNVKVRNYTECSCRDAKTMQVANRNGKPIYPEKAMYKCEECELILTRNDVTKLVKDSENQMADEYKCPQCGRLQINKRVSVKEIYQ